MGHHLVRKLDGFFKPESIAIIGVSRESMSFGGTSFLHHYLQAGYSGRLYPINPKASEVLGLKAYPSLSSLPETPDLVMIAVRADLVPAALEECASQGVRYVHVLTAGFSEIGTEEGRQLERRLAAIAEERNLLIMGPNCMGPYCPSVRLTAWGAVPGRDGNLGIISQSGGVTQRFTEYICSLGVGVSKAASIGNAAVLDNPDFLEFMADDEAIRIIAIYLESIRDGRRFFELARDVSPRKPIIMLKGGESEQGAATVASHTGRMAGDQKIWRAFFEQTGVVPVSNMNEWVDACLTFSCLPKTQGKGVFIVGGGGGNSVIFSDSCIRAGLDVPSLSRESMARIRPFVPIAGSIAGNPLDFWEAFLNVKRLFEILDIAYEDPNIHMVIVDRLIPRIAFHSPELPDSVSEIVDFIKTHRQAKPTVFTIDYDGGDPDLIRKGSQLRSHFCEAGIPAFPSFERAIGALARFQKYYGHFVERVKTKG
ncbi:MAG: CoA-binding domain-containing protein [Syntrophaceae bacterium]|nr:MAG: CoA-binding domain-containing protein [Syntrophaceae bacterium]